MSDIEKHDLKVQIARLLMDGMSVEAVQKKLQCNINSVNSVFFSDNFLTECGEHLRKSLKTKGLFALRNIEQIAGDKKASQATRLKANVYILDRALDIAESGIDSGSASNMTQDQLSRRLIELQREANKRAKPIDTGIIDITHIDIDDMLE